MHFQLLADCEDPNTFLYGIVWQMEEKLDGDRCQLVKDGMTVTAFSRNGNEVKVSDETIAMALLTDFDFVMDGELMPGGKFIAFDLISQPGSYVTRSHILRAFHMMPTVRRASSQAEKLKLFQQIKDEGGEGVVFKYAASAYTPGRPNTWQRYKFYESDSFTVKEVNLAKGSLLLTKDGVEYGWVNGPHYSKLPKEGDVIRARYDAITEKGKLLRGKYLRTETI